MPIVSADQCRSVVRFRPRECDVPQRQMNWTAAAELLLAVMITQIYLFNRLLKTTPLTSPQFGLSVGSAVLPLVLWEMGKLIVRRAVDR